jgi:hypothetical protein
MLEVENEQHHMERHGSVHEYLDDKNHHNVMHVIQIIHGGRKIVYVQKILFMKMIVLIDH